MGGSSRDIKPAPRLFGEIPETRGLFLTCVNCHRPYAVGRDVALRTWGERGVIVDVCARLRCRHCRKRGMSAALTPIKAEMGSPSRLAKLVAEIRALKPKRKIG